ncbi:MAG: hypothetical protein ABIQ31_23290 [Ferruginibacter sp.]
MGNLISKAAIKKRFKSSLQRGTGEAYQIMLKNRRVDFSTDLIRASLVNYAYHQQMEGSRGWYLAKLMALSDNKARIRKAILDALATERKNRHSLSQLFDLACIFAKKGDRQSRIVMYNRFGKKIISGDQWCGAGSILLLDGFEGLKFITTTIGKFLEKNPDETEDDGLIVHFQTDNPAIDVQAELIKESAHNKDIKIYLDRIKQNEEDWQNYQRPVYNYDTIKEQLMDRRRSYISSSYAKSLSRKEIKQVADALLVEPDRFKKGKYLSIFYDIKFPYPYQPLLQMAQSNLNAQKEVVKWAVEALRLFAGRDIRHFAVEKLSSTKAPWIYLPLLIKNYRPGDSVLLTKIAEHHVKEENVHNLAVDFIKIYKTNQTTECLAPLWVLYDKLTCGVCRKRVVEILIETDIIPDKILREIKYDSYWETRQLAMKLSKRK